MYLPNCICIDTISFRYAHFAYVDTAKYLADPLFREQGIKVKFKDEYEEENSPYHLIFCKVKKEDALSFLDAIYKLQNKMLLMGHPDYLDYCTSLLERLEITGSVNAAEDYD